jgi:hypothetical protein
MKKNKKKIKEEKLEAIKAKKERPTDHVQEKLDLERDLELL